MTDRETTRPETGPAPSGRGRRAILILAGLVLLALLASLVVHLTGRARYAKAVEQFQAALGSEVPDASEEGLRVQLVGLAPPTPPELENAARWLVAGGEGMVWAEDDIQDARELSRVPTDRWSEEQKAFVRELAERNRGSLVTMHRATPLAGSSFGLDYEDIMHVEIPNLLNLLHAAHLLHLDARLALAEGDAERGLASLDTLARLNDSLRRETILIFSLIAHVVEKLLLQGIADVLESSEPWATDPEVLNRLEDMLPTDELLAFSRRIIALDAAVISVAALEGNQEILPELTESPLRIYYLGHRQAAGYLDVGRANATLVDEPYAELRKRIPPDEDGSPNDLGPAYRNAVAKGQAAVSQRRLVAAAVEVRRAGLEQGSYPSPCPAFEALETPDPFVGRPLVCEPRDDGSLHLGIPGGAELMAEIARRESLWVTEIDLPAPPTES